MSWQLLVARSAKKSLSRFPKKDREAVLSALLELAQDPYAGDIAKIAGEQNTWRRRIGSYRIIYDLDVKRRMIYVGAIVRRTSTTY